MSLPKKTKIVSISDVQDLFSFSCTAVHIAAPDGFIRGRLQHARVPSALPVNTVARKRLRCARACMMCGFFGSISGHVMHGRRSRDAGGFRKQKIQSLAFPCAGRLGCDRCASSMPPSILIPATRSKQHGPQAKVLPRKSNDIYSRGNRACKAQPEHRVAKKKTSIVIIPDA